MALAFYISHPQVEIDPDVAVPRWHLSDVGRDRLGVIADQAWVASLGGIYSSDEVKAVETAQLLVGARAVTIETFAQMGEIDRSSTGYVSHDEHEALADAFFASPEISARGWERAVEAQARICDAVEAVLVGTDIEQNIAFVGHGGVGTLLACKLMGAPIDRQHDQPGGGHVFAFDRQSRAMVFGWTKLEDVSARLARF